MELDIDKIRVDLEKEDQVVSARVKRVFPATLEISLQEQSSNKVLQNKGQIGRIQRLASFSRWGTIPRGRIFSCSLIFATSAVPSSSLKRTEDGSWF